MITTSLTLVTAAFTIAQPVNITNIPFKKVNVSYDIMPNLPRSPNNVAANVHAMIQNGRLVVLFADNSFSKIEVTLSCNNTILFFNHYSHMVGEDITLPVQVMEVREYTIDIQKDAVHYVATFCVE